MSKLRWLGSLLLVSLAGTVIAQETAVAPVKQQQFQQEDPEG